MGEANGNAKIRTANSFDYRISHADHFPIAIDERSAGAAGSGLRIVDNFVRENVADMALCNQRADEFTAEEFVDNLCRLSSRSLSDVVYGIFTGARENGADAGGVAKREERLTTDRRLLAGIQFQNRLFQTRQIAFQDSEVRLPGNRRDANGNAGRGIGEIGCQLRDGGVQPLFRYCGKLVILPPWLRDVMIGENAAFADDEPGAEEIRANFGCAAFQCVNRVAITVVEWLAIRIDPAVAKRAAGSPVVEGTGYM